MAVLTVCGVKVVLVGLKAEETMKTSSEPMSSSVKPLPERSTGAFWNTSTESAAGVGQRQKKKNGDKLLTVPVPVLHLGEMEPCLVQRNVGGMTERSVTFSFSRSETDLCS